MKVEKLLKAISKISKFKSIQSGNEIEYSVRFNGDGSGDVYKSTNGQPLTKVTDFDTVEQLEERIRTVLDSASPYPLGSKVRVTEELVVLPVPYDTVGTVIQLEEETLQILWFGKDEDINYAWLRYDQTEAYNG